jgi:hypothetical protein
MVRNTAATGARLPLRPGSTLNARPLGSLGLMKSPMNVNPTMARVALSS